MGEETMGNTVPMPDSIVLMWLQAFPFHRKRSWKEVVVALIALKPPLWPQKENERVRERPFSAHRIWRIVF